MWKLVSIEMTIEQTSFGSFRIFGPVHVLPAQWVKTVISVNGSMLDTTVECQTPEKNGFLLSDLDSFFLW